MKEEEPDFLRRTKLNIDYTGVFHCKLGQEGFAFEHELV
jgi:hypothetical protein